MSFVFDPLNPPQSRAGMYVLRHMPTKRHYVGISVNVKRRIGQHANGKSPTKLKNAIRKYGLSQFEAIPVLYLVGSDLDFLKDVEAQAIIDLGCLGAGGFNILARGGTVGVLSPEASRTAKDRWRDPAMRQKMMDAICRAQASEETKNKRRTPEKVAQLTRASRAMRENPDSVSKLRASLSASWTPQRKAAFSAEVRGKWTNTEWRCRVLAQRQLTNQNSDVNRRRSEAVKGRVWITNGESRLRVAPDAPIPEGWWRGRGASPRKGLIGITDGAVTRFVAPGTPLPDGWQYGNIAKGRPKPPRRKEAA